MSTHEETRATLPAERVRQQVIEAWNAALPLGNLEDGFFDQGGTSFAAVLLVARLEQTLGIEVPFAVLATTQGADGLARWISARG